VIHPLKRVRSSADAGSKRALDVTLSILLLALLSPLVIVLAIVIKLDSDGSVFYRCRRVGVHGREFAMLKFRKMRDGAGGPPLTGVLDERFTRIGPALAQLKLDEIPQLWNVLKGEMSLVGPRPEDPRFVAANRKEFAPILKVRPGITGLAQLAFSRESAILDARDPEGDYLRRILPQKLQIDRLYAERRSLAKDVEILAWTAAVLVGCPVAVHRSTGRLTVRHRRKAAASTVSDTVAPEAT
jgi:lipopolysaccharide/colanic/teichoic acid biosynthesis glycosyltransferase